MIQSLPSPDGLLVTAVLATLAIGLPIFFVLSIRFLLDRNLNLGRSKELEKLIWQLHRIASTLEHEINLPSSAAQLDTKRPRDVNPLQQPAAPQNVGANAAAAAAAIPATHPARAEQPESPPAVPQPASVSQTASRETSDQGEPHGGVNSMFGL